MADKGLVPRDECEIASRERELPMRDIEKAYDNLKIEKVEAIRDARLKAEAENRAVDLSGKTNLAGVDCA